MPTCEGRLILIYGVTFHGRVWSCNWPFTRLGRPCEHTADHIERTGG